MPARAPRYAPIKYSYEEPTAVTDLAAWEAVGLNSWTVKNTHLYFDFAQILSRKLTFQPRARSQFNRSEAEW